MWRWQCSLKAEFERQGRSYEQLASNIVFCSVCKGGPGDGSPNDCHHCGGIGILPTPSLDEQLASSWWKPLYIAVYAVVEAMLSEQPFRHAIEMYYEPGFDITTLHPWQLNAAQVVVGEYRSLEHKHRCDEAKRMQSGSHDS